MAVNNPMEPYASIVEVLGPHFAAAAKRGNLGDGIPVQVSISIGSAIIGAALTYPVLRLNARHDPRKQLSWESSTERGLVAVGSQIRDNVSISYKGELVSDLVAIRCRVSNTGNQVIKNQNLRFAFPVGTKILEADFAPAPEPELKASRISPEEQSPTDRSFLIGHIEASQEVSFQLIAAGPNAENWDIHPFNENGGVDFQQREVRRIRDEQEHVGPFAIIVILFLGSLLLAQSLKAIGIFYFDVVSAVEFLVQLILFILLIPHIIPIARISRRLVARWLANAEPATNVTIQGGNPNVVATSGTVGRVDFKVPDPSS